MDIYYYAAMGGALIGLSSGLFYLLGGRIAGISGIFFDALKKPIGFRIAFILGLIAGGWAFSQTPYFRDFNINPNSSGLIIAGLLVGFGSRIANGCTSGHGICGLSRLSLRSLVAVVTFMASAIITNYFNLHLGN